MTEKRKRVLKLVIKAVLMVGFGLPAMMATMNALDLSSAYWCVNFMVEFIFKIYDIARLFYDYDKLKS